MFPSLKTGELFVRNLAWQKFVLQGLLRQDASIRAQ